MFIVLVLGVMFIAKYKNKIEISHLVLSVEYVPHRNVIYEANIFGLQIYKFLYLIFALTQLGTKSHKKAVKYCQRVFIVKRLSIML